MSSEPRLVEKRFWAISTTSSSSLLRHDGDTRPESAGAGIARRRAAAGVELVDVLDEMADDRPGIRDWVIGVIGGGDRRIGTRRAVVSRDVEGREVRDRDRQR